MRAILISFLAFLSYAGCCQDAFMTGYIIDQNGDTIRGFVKNDIESNLCQAVDFRDGQNTMKRLSVPDIKGFGFDGENNFRAITYVDVLDSSKVKTHFGKLLFEGSFRLFSFRRKDDLYFVVTGRDTSYFLFDDQRTQLGEVLEWGDYQSLLAFFAHDCARVSNAAPNVHFNEKAFTGFFQSLEQCKGNLHNTVNYYQKAKTETNVLVRAGGSRLGDKTDIAVNAMLQFLLPGISKKSGLNTGLVYLRSSDNSTQTYSLGQIKKIHVTEIFEIPLLCRYDILNKVVRPYVYGGPGIAVKKERGTTTQISFSTNESSITRDQNFGVTIVIGAGLDVRIIQGLFLNIDWRYDLLSHLPVAGIVYKFH